MIEIFLAQQELGRRRQLAEAFVGPGGPPAAPGPNEEQRQLRRGQSRLTLVHSGALGASIAAWFLRYEWRNAVVGPPWLAITAAIWQELSVEQRAAALDSMGHRAEVPVTVRVWHAWLVDRCREAVAEAFRRDDAMWILERRPTAAMLRRAGIITPVACLRAYPVAATGEVECLLGALVPLGMRVSSAPSAVSRRLAWDAPIPREWQCGRTSAEGPQPARDDWFRARCRQAGCEGMYVLPHRPVPARQAWPLARCCKCRIQARIGKARCLGCAVEVRNCRCRPGQQLSDATPGGLARFGFRRAPAAAGGGGPPDLASLGTASGRPGPLGAWARIRRGAGCVENSPEDGHTSGSD